MMNKTVFVTQSKINNLLKKVDLQRTHINMENLYHSDLGKILSIPEMKLLALFREVAGNPEVLTTDKYVKKEHQDSKRYVYESMYPSYHKGSTCERLRSDFKNFEIPVQIQAKGDKVIADYRIFFKNNIDLYNRDYEAFMAHIQLRFHIPNPPKKIEHKNSGIESVLNTNALDIETNINTLLCKMGDFRNSSESNQKEIRDCGYATHKAFLIGKHGERIRKIDIEGSIISQWHQYKNELKYLLKEYFRIKLNPDFLFNINILDQLGFKACSCC